MSLSSTRPEWHKSLSAKRQGLWSAGDSKWALSGQAGYGERVRIVLTDGSIVDGVTGEERNRWDPKHSIAVRIAGRRTRKWIPVRDIAVVWGDQGRPLVDMLAEFIEKGES